MNHIYKVIWNTITQTWVAVSELSRVKGKTKSSKTLSAVVLAIVSAGAIVGGAEAAMFAGQGDGISIQSQERNEKVAKAEGVTTIAIGYDVSSKGTSALAIGMQTHATGEKTVAIGHLATATGSESAAFGVNATAAGNGDIALGKHAVAKGGADGVTGSAALGDEAHATGAQSAAVGGKSSASGTHTIASGYKAGASGENAAAFGADSTASGTNSASIGPSSTASGSNSAALGMQAQAKGAGALAAGAAAQATKDGSTAVGTWTEATAEKTTALGDSAHATSNRATALGHDSQATGEFSTAAGVSSRASGSASVATGKNATASGANTIAIGNAANAAGTDSIATGRQAATTGSNAIATGADSSAANNASAYGNKAKATGGWSSAFGNESKAAAADASAFGNTATAAAQDSTAIGAHSSVTSIATGGTALGHSSSVTTAGGVALGQGSASTRAALDGKNITISSQGNVVSSNHITDDDSKNNNSNDVYAPVKLINDPNTLTRIKDTIKGSAGAVSLGNGTTTRQLTNLAPGSADSDAVNVAQLKAVVGSIKKYTVTSPDGSITVTSPTSGQDPQNFQISMNTTAVKDAAAWKIKANKEADDKATSVRGGDIVTFKAKDGGNSGDTIKISRNGKELTFEANYATIRTPGTGTVNVDNGVKDNWLAKAKNVAEAINASGWTLQANGDNVGLVNPGDKVNIATDANSGITITPTNEDAHGVSTIKLKANVTGLTAGKNVTISSKDGNYTISATDTNTQASVSKKSGSPITVTKTTTTPNSPDYAVGLDIDDKTLEIKGGKLAAKTQAQAVESVEKKAGDDNIAEVDVKSGSTKGAANAVYTVAVTKSAVKDAAAWNIKEGSETTSTAVKGGDTLTLSDTNTIDVVHNGKDFTFNAKTATIQTEQKQAITKIDVSNEGITTKTTGGNNTPTGRFIVPTGNNADKHALATAYDVADKVNQTGWNLYTNGGAPILINPGDYVNFKSGKATNANIVTEASEGATISYDVNVDDTTIKIDPNGNKLTANTVDLTVNNGKVTKPSTDDGKKLVNATTVANAVNNSYWKATRGTSDETNADEGDATSNVKAGDELTFVAGKNMALKKAGNTFTYGTKDNVSFTTVTSNEFVVNPNGKFTVGAGSTINMGNNIVGGVANGVADTDAVNVAQLKANTTTVVAGKNVSVDVSENASTGKTFTVNADKTTVSGTGPVSVKATSDAANHTTNYNVEFDSSKAAEQTDLTYKANGKDAKKVKLSEGLDFTNGKGTKASIGDNGKVTFDATVADVKQGDNVTINKDETTGVYTVNAKDTITTVKGKNGSAVKVTTATGSTDTNKIYEVDVNVDGKTIVNENGTLQAKGWKTKVVKGEGEVEGASEETVNGSDTVNYIAGKNVKLVQDGKNFTIATKDNVTFKDTTTTNLSVTPGGKVDMGNNKVTNVAEGTENTDAVNVKQLKDFKAEVADGGLTFAGNSGTAHKAKLNTTVNIKGGKDNTDATKFDNGKNVMTTVNGDTVTVSIKKTPEVEGINITDTTGNVKVKLTQTDEGLKVSDGNNNATRITNVKAGEKDTDAVNVKQLKAAKTEVEAGENIEITSRTDATNGQTIYKVSAKGINDTSAAVKGGSDHVKVTKAANTHKDGSTTVTDYTVDLSNKTKEDIKKGVDAHTEVTTKGLTFNADKGTTGVKKLGSKVSVNGDGKNITTTADENGVKVSMKDDIKVNSVTAKEVKVGNVNINENGINAGGKRITNVAPGKDGTDAVNVNQLKYVAGNISNQINNVDKGLRAGIAGALASGGLYHATTSGKSMVSVGAGTYRGQNALAVGYSRLSDNGKVGVKFTVNSNSQGHAGASASVGYQW
jgi:hemagglutinin family protein